MTEIEQAIGKLYGRAAEHKIRAVEIAKVAGVSHVTMSTWRTNRALPTLKNWLAVNNALDQLIAEKTSEA